MEGEVRAPTRQQGPNLWQLMFRFQCPLSRRFRRLYLQLRTIRNGSELVAFDPGCVKTNFGPFGRKIDSRSTGLAQQSFALAIRSILLLRESDCSKCFYTAWTLSGRWASPGCRRYVSAERSRREALISPWAVKIAITGRTAENISSPRKATEQTRPPATSASKIRE